MLFYKVFRKDGGVRESVKKKFKIKKIGSG